MPGFGGADRKKEERGRNSISRKPTMATAANKGTCPLGCCAGKLDGPGKWGWGELGPEGEAWGSAWGLLVGGDLEQARAWWLAPRLWEKAEVKAGHFLS